MKRLFFAFLLIQAQGFALLAPIYQSVKEIQAILASKELLEHFTPNETIEVIKHEDNSYFVSTNEQQVRVDVIYLPTSQVGPIEFKLQFQSVQ